MTSQPQFYELKRPDPEVFEVISPPPPPPRGRGEEARGFAAGYPFGAGGLPGANPLAGPGAPARCMFLE